MAQIKQSDIYDESQGNPFKDIAFHENNKRYLSLLDEVVGNSGRNKSKLECSRCGASKNNDCVCDYCGM